MEQTDIWLYCTHLQSGLTHDDITTPCIDLLLLLLLPDEILYFDNTCEQCNLDKTRTKMKCISKDQSYVFIIAVVTNRSYAQFVVVILIAVWQHTMHRV